MSGHNTLLEDGVLQFLSDGKKLKLPDFPVITDREAWDGLDDDLRNALIEDGSALAGRDWPMLLLTDYMDFGRTGNRVRFENKFFERRIRLTRLVMAECAENQGRFLDDILNGMYLIMDETSWCLPAHNTHIRDGKLRELPDSENPVVDLFAAETGALIGLSEFLLRPVLEEKGEAIAERVNAVLRKRILMPYLTEHFWWMGDGVTPMMNWTPWITQNVLLAVMTRTGETVSEDEKCRVLRQAAFSADCFVDSYGEDGCCDEGAQYYSHAGLCLFGCMDILSRITGGALDGCFSRPIVKNIGAYIVRMYVGDGYYINFADCSARPGNRSAREYLFGVRTGCEALRNFAAENYRTQTWQERLLPDEQNLYYHVLQAFAHKEMMECPAFTEKPGDFWFESTKTMLARDNRFTLAAKAGNNAESHNHNDTGSFIVYKDERPMIIDLGVETYTRQTFSDRRYEIWTMQSQYHNLPSFLTDEKAAGEASGHWIQQHDGAQYRASEVEHRMTGSEAVLEMELADAYQQPDVRSYKRRIQLSKNRNIVVEDRYEGDLPCFVSLMTYEKPEVLSEKEKPDGLPAVRIGGLGIVRLTGASSVRLEECKIEDARLGAVWKHSCWRILIGMERDRLQIAIE